MKNTSKLQKIAPKSVKYAFFCVQSGKFYTRQILFFTGTACGACDKYEVCAQGLIWISSRKVLRAVLK